MGEEAKSRLEPKKLSGNWVTCVQGPGWEKYNISSSSAVSREFTLPPLYVSSPGAFTDACPPAEALACCCAHAHTFNSKLMPQDYSKMAALKQKYCYQGKHLKNICFIFPLLLCMTSYNLLNIIQTFSSCKLWYQALINLFCKISAALSFYHNAACEEEGTEDLFEFPAILQFQFLCILHLGKLTVSLKTFCSHS